MAPRTTSLIADIGLLVRGPAVTNKSEPYVPRLGDVNDVLEILKGPQARNNPPYALAVLKAYVRSRVGARRRPQLDEDLSYLAEECPEFAPEFRATLKHYRLPLLPSFLPSTPNIATPDSTSSPSSDPPSSRNFRPPPSSFPSNSNSPYHTAPRTRFSRALRRPGLRHWHGNPGVERITSPTGDPPPPYASEDPDPDGTAMRALRLAAQSRIGLGDLAALAQTSRVDIVDLAHRSRAELAELAQSETEDGLQSGWVSETDVRHVPQVQPARQRRHTRQVPSGERESGQGPSRRRQTHIAARIPRRPAPRPPRSQTPVHVRMRAPTRESAPNDALRRLEQRSPQPQRVDTLRLMQRNSTSSVLTVSSIDSRRSSMPASGPSAMSSLSAFSSLSALRAHLSSFQLPSFSISPAASPAPRSSRRLSFPILPPLEMGRGLGLDFERESDWTLSRDSVMRDTRQPSRNEARRRFAGTPAFDHFDLDVASDVATEG